MSRPLELLQAVLLRNGLPDPGLPAGTTGTIVDLLRRDGSAYEAEVVGDDGKPLFLGAAPSSNVTPLVDP